MKLLIQLADNLVEKGHAHVSELKRWVSTVDRRYRDFSLRVAKYQESLEKSLGVGSEVTRTLPGTARRRGTLGRRRRLKPLHAALCRTIKTWSWT